MWYTIKQVHKPDRVTKIFDLKGSRRSKTMKGFNKNKRERMNYKNNIYLGENSNANKSTRIFIGTGAILMKWSSAAAVLTK